MAKYDYLVIGCGIFGAAFAQQMVNRGRKVAVIEKRGHIGGNCYTETVDGINVHKYGPHIFHTSNRRIWDYVNQFAPFNNFINRPKVRYKNRIYSFPINLMTLHQLWGVETPAEARQKLKEVAGRIENPGNLEEWALSQVGREIYEIFIKGYTNKQWGRNPRELPADIIKRIPIRLTFDDNYYDDIYQGVPIGGYTKMIRQMLEGAEVRLSTDYFTDRGRWDAIAERVVYTGRIDEYFAYEYGQLEYRSLRFDTKVIDEKDYQGNAVVNYTDEHVPYTRVIEHKHFEFGKQNTTVVTWEYPEEYNADKIPYYPVNDERNNNLYKLYAREAKKVSTLFVVGRLGTYKYLDMDDAVNEALILAGDLS
jgi:UDP-galactopyranose mutase